VAPPVRSWFGLARRGSVEAGLALQAVADLSKATGLEVHVCYALPTEAQLVGHHLYSESAKFGYRAFSDVRARSCPALVAIDRRFWHPARRDHGSKEDLWGATALPVC
jgi:hypothetical protein